MQPIQRYLLYALLLLTGLAWLLFSADKTGASILGQIQRPIKGYLAPDFTLETPVGNKISLRQLRGQAVLVNIWTTWCPPCREEMPAIQHNYLQYKNQGLMVLVFTRQFKITHWTLFRL